MKILLVCANGMSTGLIVNKMKDRAEKINEVHEIIAKPIDQFEHFYMKYDVVLLGPQVKYKKKEFQKLAKKNNIPVGVIDSLDYGFGNAEAILNYAKRVNRSRSVK